MPKVHNTAGMCSECTNLKRFRFSQYGTPNLSKCNSMFSGCVRLEQVDMGRGLPQVDSQMFYKNLMLETVSGLGSVTSIGEQAFVYTPRLADTDLRSEKVQSIGADACRLSGIEDCADLACVSTENVGELATRHERWSEETLAAMETVDIPDVYIEVPNPDNQSNYPELLFGTKDGEPLYIAESGCAALALYHAWNALHAGTGEEYADFADWWNAMIVPTDFVANNAWTDDSDFLELLAAVGWERIERSAVAGMAQLQKTIDRLKAGFPVFASMHSANTLGGKHAVLIIGCNGETRKLAILDPNVTGTTGTVAWVAFEDIFTEVLDDYDYIDLIDYKV